MKPLVQFGDSRQSGEAFHARYTRAATALRHAGLGSGEVVALMLRNEPVMLELMLAARWLGARWCMVNWHFKSAEVRHILADSQAKLLVVHADLLGQIAGAVPPGVRVFVVEPLAHTRRAFALAPGPPPDVGRELERWDAFRDAATGPIAPQQMPGSAMVYTSGTTGLPKGIRREPATPEQLALIAERSRQVLGIEAGMRALISAPLYHSAPVAYVVQAALNDAQLVIEPRFDAEQTLQLIEAERITHLYLVPTMFVRLLRLEPERRQQYDLSSVKFVASTGSPCSPGIKRQMIDWWGPVLTEYYASTEGNGGTIVTSERWLTKPGTVGTPFMGILHICNQAGDVLGPGEVGLVYWERDTTFFEYHNDPAKTAAARHPAHENWSTVGDLGYVELGRGPPRRRRAGRLTRPPRGRHRHTLPGRAP